MPVSAWSKLDIINNTFNILGKRSVNTLTDAGEFADSANRTFELLYPLEISLYDWRFATKIKVLSKLVTTPEDDIWRYAYNLPSDYLTMRRIIPNSAYQIYEDQLWTNVDALKCEYRFLPDPTQCPAYFVNYFCLVLAQRYAHTVAEDSQLARALMSEVKIARGVAMAIDGQARPSMRLFENPVITSRFGGDYIDSRYRGN